MGLADRDYMRERARERAESRGAVFAPNGYGRAARRRRLLAWCAGGILALFVAAFALGWIGPAGRMGPMEVVDAQAGDPGAAAARTAPPRGGPNVAEVAFPESGTVEWGDEGQPIGGNLERLDIWDVTGSRQDKVVHVRGGPQSTFAVIYLAPGQRTTIMVPVDRAYKVTATSGDRWMGTAERFGPDATTVDFGMVEIRAGSPGVVAMGAPDQTASVVPNDRF